MPPLPVLPPLLLFSTLKPEAIQHSTAEPQGMHSVLYIQYNEIQTRTQSKKRVEAEKDKLIQEENTQANRDTSWCYLA